VSARDDIFTRVSKNRPKGAYPAPVVPRFPLAQPDGLVEAFSRRLADMGGRVASPSEVGDLPTWIQTQFNAKVVCSAVSEIGGNRDLSQVQRPRDLADVDVAVVRAVLGVAETGSVLFTETQLRVNTLAYLAQHLVVLLKPTAIVKGVQDAYDHPAFRTARYAVFHTGPSATGDIEGVLIHGAQGVRSLTVILKD
jgi:L-lactate dehydrogenase complex protein LldG